MGCGTSKPKDEKGIKDKPYAPAKKGAKPPDKPGAKPGVGVPPKGKPGEKPPSPKPGDKPPLKPGEKPPPLKPGEKPPTPKPGEKPGDKKPGDKPGEKPGEKKPGEKPGEKKPGEKPGEKKPDDKKAGDKPDEKKAGEPPKPGAKPGEKPPTPKPGEKPATPKPGEKTAPAAAGDKKPPSPVPGKPSVIASVKVAPPPAVLASGRPLGMGGGKFLNAQIQTELTMPKVIHLCPLEYTEEKNYKYTQEGIGSVELTKTHVFLHDPVKGSSIMTIDYDIPPFMVAGAFFVVLCFTYMIPLLFTLLYCGAVFVLVYIF